MFKNYKFVLNLYIYPPCNQSEKLGSETDSVAAAVDEGMHRAGDSAHRPTKSSPSFVFLLLLLVLKIIHFPQLWAHFVIRVPLNVWTQFFPPSVDHFLPIKAITIETKCSAHPRDSGSRLYFNSFLMASILLVQQPQFVHYYLLYNLRLLALEMQTWFQIFSSSYLSTSLSLLHCKALEYLRWLK